MNRARRTASEAGFTMIELLVVLLVARIPATVAGSSQGRLLG